MFLSIRQPVIAVVLSTLLILIMLPLPGSATLQANSSALSVPDPRLQPEDVVKIVLDALANNDTPYTDAGIETTFNFASPSNKAQTGPLERFAVMVKGPVYGVMVDHKSHQLGEIVMSNNRAYQWARLVTASGVAVHFGFRLGLQSDGEFKGMWMTEAVWPLDGAIEEISI
jgi:hypothetical protein